MRGATPSGGTAKTLVLIGLILDIIGELILLVVGIAFLFLPFVGLFLLVFAIIGFVWIALIWVFSYSRIRNGDYQGARGPTIVFAILSLLTLAIVPFILFLIAYIKLGDAIRESQSAGAPAWGTPPPPPPPPLAGGVPAQAGTRFCSHCGRANPPGGAFCQGCGAPLG